MSITTGSEEERIALRERLTRLGASVLDKMQSHDLPHVLVAKRARGTKYDVRGRDLGSLPDANRHIGGRAIVPLSHCRSLLDVCRVLSSRWLRRIWSC